MRDGHGHGYDAPDTHCATTKELNVNKAEFVDSIIDKTGWSKREAEEAVKAFVETVTDAVASGEKVTLPGFGTFEKRDRAARTARNPQTGEQIKVKKTTVPAFRSGSAFKSYVAMSKKDQTAYRKGRG
jgi:DNA-binding protein HU-beta